MSRSAVSDSDGSGSLGRAPARRRARRPRPRGCPVSVLTRSRRSLEASLASSALYGERRRADRSCGSRPTGRGVMTSTRGRASGRRRPRFPGSRRRRRSRPPPRLRASRAAARVAGRPGCSGCREAPARRAHRVDGSSRPRSIDDVRPAAARRVVTSSSPLSSDTDTPPDQCEHGKQPIAAERRRGDRRPPPAASSGSRARSTTPATGDVIAASIFIASIEATGWPAATSSPDARP